MIGNVDCTEGNLIFGARLLKSPDCQLGGALNQSLPVLGGDSASDLGAEGLVGHHQDLELLHVVNQHLLEAGGEHVPGAGS